MYRITRLRPSPALVVATIALLVALGGTSAAAVALLPRNSVGSAQVIDGSLKSRDFHAGALPAQTVVFSAPSPVQSRSTPGTPRVDPRLSVATLSIPRPGTYLLSAKGRFTVNDADHLRADRRRQLGHEQRNVPTRPVGGETFKATLSHLAVHVFAEPGDVDLRCTTPGKGTAFAARDVTLVAMGIARQPLVKRNPRTKGDHMSRITVFAVARHGRRVDRAPRRPRRQRRCRSASLAR